MRSADRNTGANPSPDNTLKKWEKPHLPKPVTAVFSAVVTFSVWIIIWQIAYANIGISFIFPSPYQVVVELLRLLPQKKFIISVTGSMLRVILGYLIGIAASVAASFASHFFLPLKIFFSPFVKIVRATPVASFILICVLWMPSDAVPVFIAFLMVFPVVYENTLTGLSETPVELKEVASVYGFSRRQKLTLLYIPSVAPYFASACTTSLGLAWKAGISAEVLCVTRDSIGYYIYISKQYFETASLFAWTVAIIVLSVLLELAIKKSVGALQRALRRKYAGK